MVTIGTDDIELLLGEQDVSLLMVEASPFIYPHPHPVHPHCESLELLRQGVEVCLTTTLGSFE